MHNILTLYISAISLRISSQIAFFLDNYDQNYHNFLFHSLQNSTSSIDIFLILGDMPDISPYKKIFESNESWSMFRNNNYYYMQLSVPHSEKPLWIAEMNDDFSKINVYCAEELVHHINNKKALANPVRYPLDQIITMHYLSSREGVIMHAAGIELNGKGFIFLGRSGTGKSTLAREFLLHQDIVGYSDDRMIVRKLERKFYAFGTPWPGEEEIAVNKGSSLAGIFFLAQSSVNRIETITSQEAAKRLLPVVSIPWYDKEVLPKILDFCDELISSVPVYVLHFKPGTEVVDVFENFVSN